MKKMPEVCEDCVVVGICDLHNEGGYWNHKKTPCQLNAGINYKALGVRH
jgi:hypothetical protein